MKREVFDLVLCRNVLIYFPVESQNVILRNITKSLKVGGYLVLGKTEWLEDFDLKYLYKPISLVNKIFVKIGCLHGS